MSEFDVQSTKSLSEDIKNSSSFDSISLSDPTQRCIGKMGFEKMTDIQAKCIPPLMEGKDLIGAAKTGSGKTLAFLVPAFELLHKEKFKQRSGTGVLIISPTRELALQIYGVAKKFCEEHKSRSFGIIMGGCNRSQEAKRLSKNINLLVATPGRLLDHLKNTKDFIVRNLRMLIIDEADRILDNGFEQEIRQILEKIPKERQTVLFSATQTNKMKDLIKLSFRTKPEYFGVDDAKKHSTRSGLTQGYVKIEAEDKFLLLYSFLRRNKRQKVIVFMSTCNATKFYSSLLNYVDIPVLELHGKIKQTKRTATFFEFINADFGCLLATDVAARGLDIPSVDWIIQYDPPDDPKAYIHRVGRTARGLNGEGRALLFLLPNEMSYLQTLQEKKVPIKEFEFPENKIDKVQSQLEELVTSNYYLGKSAKMAFRSYLQFYSQMTNRYCFDVHALDVYKVAKAFGFDAPPRINLNIGFGKKSRKRMRQFEMKTGYKRSIKQFSR